MNSQNIREWLSGPMIAVATPFKEDYSLDLDALQSNIRYMIERGVRTGHGSLLVGGAGGEHPTMNVQERKDVMSAAMDAAQGEAAVLTSIQHTDYRVVLELAQHVERAGLQGAQLGPTYYYEPTEDDAFRLFELVNRESGARLMIYHTWWEGLTMSLPLLKELSDIPTVEALKWSAPNDSLYRKGLTALSDELVVIDNSNQQILSHVLGARGFITHLSGFWPEYPNDVWDLLERRDYAGAKDKLASFKWKWVEWRARVCELTGGEGPFIKAAMEAVGLPAGPPRPPSVRPPEHLMEELRELLKECNVPMADGDREMAVAVAPATV